MKKLLFAVIMVAMLAATSMTSLAAEGGSAEKKAERQAFKAAIAQQRQEVKETREVLKTQREENKALTQAIKEVIKADKKSEDPQISEETLAQIQLLFEEIKAVRADLKAGRPELEQLRDTLKQAKEALDAEGASDALGTLASLLDDRLISREDIAAILGEIDVLVP